jgi:pimeloyl-ACP methyl ester carboxylesterase
LNIRKVLKRIAVGISILLLAGLTFVVVSSYLEHRQLIEEEKTAYPAPGMLVEVGSDILHVYAEGEGDPTLVFLSGLGTSSPYYDFKDLFERLSDEYRVAVVERAGYGWSEITSSPRDLDTVLNETRTALQRAGESPPYVLFPHSLAGLEALYWASNYPEEVEAIIGLDPLVPEYHELGEDDASLSPFVTFLARTGLMRSGPDVFAANFPAMVAGRLTEREAEVAETIFMRRTNTRNMYAEIDALPENVRLVLEQGKPDVPFHVFISDRGTEAWKESLIAYAEATGGEYFLLDAEHYLHLDRPELIAETSSDLIEAAE